MSRRATGLVTLSERREPYLEVNASASFYDEVYADHNPCADVTAGRCTVQNCLWNTHNPPDSVTRPLAGVIHGTVDQQPLEIEPIRDTAPAQGFYPGSIFMPRSSSGELQGGEVVTFQAPGEPNGVPAFSGQVIAPVYVRLTSPESPRLRKGAPFELDWAPASPNGVVRVELSNATPTSMVTVTCDLDARLQRGQIPAAMIDRLPVGRVGFFAHVVSSTVVTAGPFAVKIEVVGAMVSDHALIGPR